MRLFLIILVFFFMASVVCHAQQDPIYSQYMFNLLNVNPAYAGSRNVLSINAVHRSQWASQIPGAPNTSTLTADMPVMQNKLGLGLALVHDRIGRFQNSMINVFAAYRLKVDRKGTLAMGLSGGISRLHAELSSIRANPQGTGETLFQDYSRFYPVIGAGFYYSRDNWYLGLSAPNLLSSYEALYSEEASVVREFQHLYLMGGYVFELSEEVVLKPSFMLRNAVGAPVSLDLNANLWLHEMIGIGISYRMGNAVIPLVEVQATRQFRFGYALDYTLSDLKNENRNPLLSHEFLLRYEFGFKKKNVLSPRYF